MHKSHLKKAGGKIENRIQLVALQLSLENRTVEFTLKLNV